MLTLIYLAHDTCTGTGSAYQLSKHKNEPSSRGHDERTHFVNTFHKSCWKNSKSPKMNAVNSNDQSRYSLVSRDASPQGKSGMDISRFCTLSIFSAAGKWVGGRVQENPNSRIELVDYRITVINSPAELFFSTPPFEGSYFFNVICSIWTERNSFQNM